MESGVTRPRMALALVVASTVLGLMGTDLVLPAVPSLSATLGGGPAEAQLVLAAYVGGTSVGRLVFGALGDRFATLIVFKMLDVWDNPNCHPGPIWKAEGSAIFYPKYSNLP